MELIKATKPSGPLTVRQLAVGSVFRKWDGVMCRLVAKTDSRAILDPGHQEVSAGCEVLEELATDLFIHPVKTEPNAEGRGDEKDKTMSKGTLETLKELRTKKVAIIATATPGKSMQKVAKTPGYKYPNPATCIIEYVDKCKSISLVDLKLYLKKTGNYNDKAISNQLCYAKRFFAFDGETFAFKDSIKPATERAIVAHSNEEPKTLKAIKEKVDMPRKKDAPKKASAKKPSVKRNRPKRSVKK